MLRGAELGRRRAFQAEQVAGRLDHGHLHAETDAEERHVALARELNRMDLALGAAFAEAARHQDAVHVLEMADRIVALEYLGVHPLQADLHVAAEAAMGQRLAERLVGVEQHRVLADHGDGHLALGLAHRAHHAAPALEVGFLFGLQAEIAADLGVEALLVIGDRHLVDRVDVARLDDALLLDVAEQRDLAPLVGRDLLVARAADQAGRAGYRRSTALSPSAGVGLVLSSPAVGTQGSSVRCTNIVRSRPSSLPS